MNEIYEGPVGPRWAQCWPHEPCYQGTVEIRRSMSIGIIQKTKDAITCPWSNAVSVKVSCCSNSLIIQNPSWNII